MKNRKLIKIIIDIPCNGILNKNNDLKIKYRNKI